MINQEVAYVGVKASISLIFLFDNESAAQGNWLLGRARL